MKPGSLHSPHGGPLHKRQAECGVGICRHTMEIFRFPFICELAGCVHAMHVGLTRGIATYSPCSLATMPARERLALLQIVGSRGKLCPHRVCWCVGSFLLAAREISALQPAELLPVPSRELADFSLNAHLILAWLLNECRKCWEIHVDLYTAGDLV